MTVTAGQGARYVTGQSLFIFGGLGTSEQNQSEGLGVGFGTPLTVSSITPGGGTGGGDLITFTGDLANSYTHVSGTLLSDPYGPYACTGAYLTPYQCATANSVAGRALKGEDQQNGLHLISCQRFRVNASARNTWESPVKCGTGFASTFLTDGCAHGEVSGGVMRHGYDQGVSVWNSINVNVTGCKIDSGGWTGVSLSAYSDKCTVSGNHILNSVYSVPGSLTSGHGIAVEGGSHDVVTGNVISGVAGVGLYPRLAPPVTGIGAGNSPTLSAFLEAQTAAGTSIQFSSTSQLLAGYKYSFIDGPRTESLTIATVVDGTHVTFSTAPQFSHPAATYMSARITQDCLFTGNVIDGTGLDGINPLASVRCEFTDNKVHRWGAGFYGINLQTTSNLLPATLGGDGALVKGNDVTNGAGQPLIAQGVSGITVTANRLGSAPSGSSYRGAEFISVTDSVVTLNTVSELLDGQGIQVGSGCARMTVSGNKVRRCSSQGILVTSSDSIAVEGNQCSSNGDGIVFTGVTRSRILGNTCNSNNNHGVQVTNNGGTLSQYNVVQREHVP